MNQQLFGWSEQTWLMLDQIGILAGDIMLTLSVTAAIVGWLKRDYIRRWFGRNRFPHIGGRPEGGEWRSLLFTVSREDLPRWVIQQLEPEKVGLLVTEHSVEAGQHILDYCRQQGIAASRRMIDNPDDAYEVHQRARELLAELSGDDGGRIAVDITGGKVPMSLGAFMAAEEYGIDTLYVSTRFENGRPDMRTAEITTVSRSK